MKTLLVIGNDRISGEALKQISPLTKNFDVAIDHSTGIRRITRLLISKRLPPFLLIRMLFCSILQEGEKPQGTIASLSTNQSLQELICHGEITRVILFRAGLIINAKTIEIGIPIYNIHCARIPEYAGLGSIWNAIQDRAWNQEAILHHVTTTIDSGIIIDSEPYTLASDKTYCQNEQTAYRAGVCLLKRTIERIDSGENISSTPKRQQYTEEVTY